MPDANEIYNKKRIMKKMTEEQCRAFVMSGFIPTSNEDIADLQDCFNHQSVDFQLGLLIDVETHENAEKLMRACLHCEEEVDSLHAQAAEISKRLTLRKQYVAHIARMEQKIKEMRMYLDDTIEEECRFGQYMD